MKNILLLITCGFLSTSISAQLAKRYILFEHFTQASCAPCAAQNPPFQNQILANNGDDVHHIAFHTSWPGVDPMNAHNKTQVKSRVDYYGVNGVPSMIMDGVDEGSPAAITQQMVDIQQALGSPVKVEVSQQMDDTAYYVTVKVTSVGDVPSGTYKLLVAMVEKEVVYATAPGTNGEKDFPNVFRKMVTADNGNAITLPAKGEFTEFTFSVPKNSVWQPEQIYSIAYIQDAAMDILNSGSSMDSPSPITYGLLGDPNRPISAGTPGTGSAFTLEVKNTGSNAETYKLTLAKDAPADWSGSVTINGTTITDMGTISIPAGTSYNAVITVTPGASPFVGSFSLTFASEDSPGTIVFTKSVRVISNVSDLVISSKESAGSFSSAKEFESIYMDGLATAGNTKYASSDNEFLEQAIREGAMDGVRNVYLNVGWSFGVFTDGMINELSSFIDNGGNLFLAGQDIAWESNDSTPNNPYFNVVKRDFFRNKLKLGFVSDNAASNFFIANNAEFFASMANSAINSTFYGTVANSYYPDQISIPSTSIAKPIFYYNTARTMIAAARWADPATGGKLVYVGIGPEQLTDNNKKAQLIKLSHDYFYSSIGISELRNTSELIGECFPNPATNMVTINFGKLDKDMVLNVVDVTGKNVYTQPLWSDIEKTNIITSAWAPGIYHVQLSDENTVLATRKFVVVK